VTRESPQVSRWFPRSHNRQFASTGPVSVIHSLVPSLRNLCGALPHSPPSFSPAGEYDPRDEGGIIIAAGDIDRAFHRDRTTIGFKGTRGS